MLEARTLSVSVDRPWQDLFEAIWRPEIFPCWASGLSQSSLRREGTSWRAEGPEGAVMIRFTDHNAFGIMDHVVTLASGADIHVPMRVVPNGNGAEVLLTLFRQPSMSAEKFAADADWVRRDLQRLKAQFETKRSR